MDKELIRTIVTNNLGKININIDDLKESTQSLLESIEEAIQAKIENINSCVDTLKSISFDVCAIANDIGLSRQSFYNNYKGLLKQYVEISTKDIRKLNPLDLITQLHEDKSFLKKDIENLMIRDVKTEVLEKQIEDLQQKLDEAHKKDDANIERIIILENKVISLENKLSNK